MQKREQLISRDYTDEKKYRKKKPTGCGWRDIFGKQRFVRPRMRWKENILNCAYEKYVAMKFHLVIQDQD
jgi:hypothetical protein